MTSIFGLESSGFIVVHCSNCPLLLIEATITVGWELKLHGTQRGRNVVSIGLFTRWINLPPTWNFRDCRQELENAEHRNGGSYRIKWSNDVLYEFGPSFKLLNKIYLWSY